MVKSFNHFKIVYQILENCVECVKMKPVTGLKTASKKMPIFLDRGEKKLEHFTIFARLALP